MIGPDTGLGFAAGNGPRYPGEGSAFDIPPAVDLDAPILVIEDEAMIAWMVETLLEDMGFTSIALAATGEQAIEMAQDLRPGLIVTDINLGAGIDGIAAAAIIQAELAPAVIFITGYGLDEARERVAKVIPGTAVLRKPVQVAELRGAISDALGGSASRN